jgi:hypothetical protein
MVRFATIGKTRTPRRLLIGNPATLRNGPERAGSLTESRFRGFGQLQSGPLSAALQRSCGITCPGLKFPCCNSFQLAPYSAGPGPLGNGSPVQAPKDPVMSGRSSGVEHNLAKVGVGRSNRLARSSFLNIDSIPLIRLARRRGAFVPT